MLIASEIIDRILIIKGFKTDVKLAQYWDVSATTVTNWRKRNSIPFEKIITFCKNNGVRLDYIFTGEGKVTRGSEPEKKIQVTEESPLYKVEDLDDDSGMADLLEAAMRVFSGSRVAIETEKRLKKIEEEVSEIKDKFKQRDHIRNF